MAPVQPYHGAKLLAELQQRLKLYKYPEWAQLKQRKEQVEAFLKLLRWIASKFPPYVVDGMEKQLVSDQHLSTGYRLLRRLWVIFRCHFGLQPPFDEMYFLNEASSEERCSFLLQVLDFMEEYDLLRENSCEFRSSQGYSNGKHEEMSDSSHNNNSILSSKNYSLHSKMTEQEYPFTHQTQVYYRNVASLSSSDVHSIDEEPKPHTPLEAPPTSTSFASSVTFSSPPESCMMTETRFENLLGKMLAPIEQDIHRLSDRLGRVELQMDRMELQIDHLVSQMRKQQALKHPKSEEHHYENLEASFHHSYAERSYATGYETSVAGDDDDECLEDQVAAFESVPSLENPSQAYSSNVSRDNDWKKQRDAFNTPSVGGSHDNLEDFLKILREKMNNARDILQRATERNSGY